MRGAASMKKKTELLILCRACMTFKIYITHMHTHSHSRILYNRNKCQVKLVLFPLISQLFSAFIVVVVCWLGWFFAVVVRSFPLPLISPACHSSLRCVAVIFVVPCRLLCRTWCPIWVKTAYPECNKLLYRERDKKRARQTNALQIVQIIHIASMAPYYTEWVCTCVFCMCIKCIGKNVQ